MSVLRSQTSTDSECSQCGHLYDAARIIHIMLLVAAQQTTGHPVTISQSFAQCTDYLIL